MSNGVQQRPLPSNARRNSPVVSGAALDRLQTPFERFVGWALLAISFAGSVLALNNGVAWPLTVEAFAGGVALQLLLTVIQWVWGIRRKGWRWYNITAIAFGTGLTVYGWAPLLHGPTSALWGRMEGLPAVAGQPGAIVAAWVTIAVLALLNEVLPEYILVS